jgi:hypothetical protein
MNTITIPVKEFFTDAEWDLLYNALSEYQDHEESYDEVKDLMSKISKLF